MSSGNTAATHPINQICIVVNNIVAANNNWAKVLQTQTAVVETFFPEGIIHYTDGEATAYHDLQVAKYDLGNIVVELIQPGATDSPWKRHLEKHGQGVFHVCLSVDNRKNFHQHTEVEGTAAPYHIGYFPSGSYSYVDTKESLGIELSINSMGDSADLFSQIANGSVQPLDELN